MSAQSLQHLPPIIQALAPTITHYGYIAVGGLILLEDFGVPVPGETTLIAAAVFAGLGHLNILLVVLVAYVAAVVGDNIGFAIGDFGGRRLIDRFGKYVFLTPTRIDKAEAYFDKNGGKVVIIGRFVEGLRQLNGLVAGTSEMRWSTFITCNAIGAALWVGAWSSVGYFGGDHIELLHSYGVYVSTAGAALIVAYIIYHIIRHRRLKSVKTAD